MPPDVVFIIPYRNRIPHKDFFLYYIKKVLADVSYSFEIYFAHQCDDREFNRGGTKNIGFLYVKNKYPEDYKNITFVFNDIDTLPYKSGLLDYKTVKNNVKHFYGFDFALGGIVSIIGEDFEKINGFPNFFGWGGEDNTLQERCIANNIKIDRSNFFEIGDNSILQLFDSYIKKYDPSNISRFLKKGNNDGINTLYNVNYKCDQHDDHFMVNIYSFDGLFKENPEKLIDHDLRTGNQLKSQIHFNKKTVSRLIFN
tara:strand:+ start:1986 stop:2750 length:765 start_codon:yes stop_codon:yes gene_type:complete